MAPVVTKGLGSYWLKAAWALVWTAAGFWTRSRPSLTRLQTTRHRLLWEEGGLHAGQAAPAGRPGVQSQFFGFSAVCPWTKSPSRVTWG